MTMWLYGNHYADRDIGWYNLWHIYHVYPSLGHIKHLPRIVYAHPRKNHTDDDHQRWSLHSKDGRPKKSYLPNPQVLNLGISTERLSTKPGRFSVDSWPNLFKGYFKGGAEASLIWCKMLPWKIMRLEGVEETNWRVEKFCRCNKQLVLEVLSKNGTRKMNLVLDPWFYVMTSKHLKPVDWSWLMLQILNILLNTVASLSKVTHVI